MKTKLPIARDRAKLIKQLLYEGKAQEHIAVVAGCDQSTISRIKSGRVHHDVPWPNGTFGPMPIEVDRVARKDANLKWSPQATIYQSLPAALQERMLDVVNVNRAALSIEEIPPVASSYEEYLTASANSEDSLALIDARDAEDSRICLVVDEFRELVEIERTHQRSRELFTILQVTSHNGTELEPPIKVTGNLLYDKMEWSEVESRGYKVPVVMEAATRGDECLQEACCIVLYVLRNTPEDSWEERNVEREIRRIAERLRKTIELGGARADAI